jgi:hypothetical protein
MCEERGDDDRGGQEAPATAGDPAQIAQVSHPGSTRLAAALQPGVHQLTSQRVQIELKYSNTDYGRIVKVILKCRGLSALPARRTSTEAAHEGEQA